MTRLVSLLATSNDIPVVRSYRQPFKPGREVDAPLDDITTEGERQLQVLVKKQLNTNISVEGELARKKEFRSGSSLKSLSEEVAGTRDHNAYKKLMDRESVLEDLMLCGLSEEEINFKLAYDGFDTSDKVSNKKRKVELKKELSIDAINDKVRLAMECLGKADKFSGAKVMSRHEMDLEKAISKDNDKAKMLGCLLTMTRRNDTDPNDPINNLDGIYMDALARSQDGVRQNKDHCNTKQEQPKHINDATVASEMSPANNDFLSEPLEPMPEAGCAPKPWTVTEINDSDVVRYRLNVDEIKRIPKFKDYAPGVPTKVLFVKNLSPKVHKEDLVELFKKFDTPDHEINYRLLTGRMKGQAFLTFSTVSWAIEALNFANGFPLHGKPVIIHYGKKQK